MSLRPSEIAARVAQSDPRHSLYRSLDEIAAYQYEVEGIEFGLTELDRLTGGLRPRKLNIVGGYAHHGKTSLMLKLIEENVGDKPCLFISGDDTDDVILRKLIAYREHLSTDEVYDLGPQWRRDYVAEHFSENLVLAATKDDYTVDEVAWTYELAAEELGEPPAIVCFDYASLLKLQAEASEAFNNIRDKFRALKKFIRKAHDSVWVIGHQCVKSAEDARALTLNHLEYGGHQEADGVIIGCRRNALHNLKDHELWEEKEHPKVYISVMKNKVNGRKSMNPVGTEYIIDPVSGMIREVLDSDRPTRVMGGMSRPALRLPSLSVARAELEEEAS